MPKKPTPRSGRDKQSRITVPRGGVYARGDSSLERMQTVGQHAEHQRAAFRANPSSPEGRQAYTMSRALSEAHTALYDQDTARRAQGREDRARAPRRGGGPAPRPRGRPRAR